MSEPAPEILLTLEEQNLIVASLIRTQRLARDDKGLPLQQRREVVRKAKALVQKFQLAHRKLTLSPF